MSRWERVFSLAESLNCGAYIISKPVNIRYLSGYRGEASLLVLFEDGPELFTDFRCLEEAEEESIKECRLFEVPNNRGIWDYVLEHIKAKGIKRVAFESRAVSYESYERIKTFFDTSPVANGVEKLRSIKSEEEIENIRRAGEMVLRGYDWLLDNLRPGLSERWIEVQLEAFLRNIGAEDRAFPFIIAAGENGAKPHARPSQRRISKGESLVCDFGVVYNGYHVDVTRTFMLGEVPSKMKDVYLRVREAQERVLEEVKPGVKVRDLFEMALKSLGEWGEFFKHALGHGVGLEIHESPRLSLNSEEVLEEGMVITIEPGVYLRGEFGIRIEDTIVIRKNGPQILTPLPKEGLLCL